MTLYLYHFDFPATRGNHAGMSHMARWLAAKCADVVEVPQRRFAFKGGEILRLIDVVVMALYFRLRLRKNDTLFLVEYATPKIQQHCLAAILRFIGVRFGIQGIAHLAKSHYLERFAGEDKLRRVMARLDHVVTFGSSLERDLKMLGIQNVDAIGHYVDTDYYRGSAKNYAEKLKVVVMGSLKRDPSKLPQIIDACKNVEFHVCLGARGRPEAYRGFDNCRTYGFLNESQLRAVMDEAHISLSLMHDTIGSNVIVTSFAMGLVNIASDVGSIRDYCDDSNSVLCDTVDSFVRAVRNLDSDRTRLEELSIAARKKAMSLSLEPFSGVFLSCVSAHKRGW